jgi:hypothetical protein
MASSAAVNIRSSRESLNTFLSFKETVDPQLRADSETGQPLWRGQLDVESKSQSAIGGSTAGAGRGDPEYLQAHLSVLTIEGYARIDRIIGIGMKTVRG